MSELISKYTRAQIANLPKKRRALNRVVKRLKVEREGKNRPEVVMELGREFKRRYKYLSKNSKQKMV